MRSNLIPECIQKMCSNPPDSYSYGETWESIRFPEGYEKPPKEAFEAKLQELIDAQPWKELRQERNEILQSTDFLMVSDFPFPSEDIRTAWRTYRQALRDLPVTSPPSYDENGHLVVTWPKPPIWPPNVV